MIAVAPLPTTLPDWRPAETVEIDRSASYYVETNGGGIEAWSGALLYSRMRPGYVHGRAVRVAKVESSS